MWKKPHISKIYEALTAIGDRRIEIDENDPNKAKCFSSSKGKFYDVIYDPGSNLINSNDNSAYHTETLSYPMIAFLMTKGFVSYSKSLLEPLKGIYWKEINQKNKNDYSKAIEYVLDDLNKKGIDTNFIEKEVEKIYSEVSKLKIGRLGNKITPPEGW
ncbi:hypothetical protein A2108_00605 [Candidatus Wolfebacteria bacterium GWA1_42_9]|uniref:Uncharacterized protein n=1 Tax=Candidatus Wolfebacteria bacterium GWA1_42_9 TaxID=1802553 RepID=A0A1F8DNE8_9BACT|nr:MAG: hypothetical protein A2108_00605 [Candidatus Wolfebacteria bacterium GWA1_42_9]